mmetsp:Transcript_3790/g.7948  ORF Transcript_3790/g.7948 Transcript_3790/m.7948 type:complete len:324 (-) Transcript_3790:127-1098(-)|eukprot:CAMPEP_0194316328 /NCGR_PEP_ID=MMETSP0171-20130528/13137_1 /TAXON_ID=218684 /ORGANISM="Corethron pennatum, Strain L29A3" /LENGTH=323 /DNA_ID=CAMNT_0039072527 /DNA_START=209 /DNA_END=1180 /DNA_ORIENTATION=+
MASSPPAYSWLEDYFKNTPLVTRYMVNGAVISSVVSLFVDTHALFINSPHLAVFRLEVYRVVTSLIPSGGILSLLLVLPGLFSLGLKIERRIGSAEFGFLIFFPLIAMNVAFDLICAIAFFATNSYIWTSLSCGSQYDLLFFLLSVDCLLFSDPSEKRRISCLPCGFETRHYPFWILGLVSLLLGPNPSFFWSVAVGYAYSHGKLNFLKPKRAAPERWEREGGCLENFAARPGWTVGCSGGGLSAEIEGGDGAAWGARVVAAPAVSTVAPKLVKFPGSGKTVGGTGLRAGARALTGSTPLSEEVRAAMLAAAERRSKTSDRDT